MNMYRVVLEDDEFEIINAESDDEAICFALDNYDFLYNVELLDDNFDYVKTVY